MLAHWSRNRRITPMEGPERRTGARSWLRSLCPGKAVGSGDTWMTPQGRATVVEWEIGGGGQGGPNRQGEQMKNRDELICAIFWKPQVLNHRSNGGDVSTEPWGTSQETSTAGSRCLSPSLTCALTLSPSSDILFLTFIINLAELSHEHPQVLGDKPAQSPLG